jgi:hypothetical protein
MKNYFLELYTPPFVGEIRKKPHACSALNWAYIARFIETGPEKTTHETAGNGEIKFTRVILNTDGFNRACSWNSDLAAPPAREEMCGWSN